MSLINISNLTFSYDTNYDNIFENVTISLDSDWKLGFIGRNGRGKTTFLKLLMKKYDYNGKILASVNFDYFPFEVEDKTQNSCEIFEKICPDSEFWQLSREVSLLDCDQEILFRPFETLSNGEQTKLLLAILFSKENNFLLIDEPTNHLDFEGRELVLNYLKNKNGFILVSHDRNFLNSCVDHILSINRTNIEVMQGNFSSWWQNKNNQDNFELAKNEKLKKEIDRLHKSAKRTANWADKVEITKNGTKISGLKPDKGHIGRMAAKMMKRSKVSEKNKNRAIDEKSKLLKNIEFSEDLKLNYLTFSRSKLIEISNLSINYGGHSIFENLNFVVKNGDRIWIKGKNGCGKTSLMKLILGQSVIFEGNLNITRNLKISYVSQNTSHLNENLSDFSKKHHIDESLFKTILRKFGFSRAQFEKNIENFSEGQKKKVLLSKSLCESAHLYLWDEPLNFIDVLSRIQIENLILKYKPTIIFIEHDKIFSEKIATKTIDLFRN